MEINWHPRLSTYSVFLKLYAQVPIQNTFYQVDRSYSCQHESSRLVLS